MSRKSSVTSFSSSIIAIPLPEWVKLGLLGSIDNPLGERDRTGFHVLADRRGRRQPPTNQWPAIWPLSHWTNC